MDDTYRDGANEDDHHKQSHPPHDRRDSNSRDRDHFRNRSGSLSRNGDRQDHGDRSRGQSDPRDNHDD